MNDDYIVFEIVFNVILYVFVGFFSVQCIWLLIFFNYLSYFNVIVSLFLSSFIVFIMFIVFFSLDLFICFILIEEIIQVSQ